jgi:hypothetical protein
MEFHRRRLRARGIPWATRVGGLTLLPSAQAGYGGDCRGGSMSFNYAAPSDNVVPTNAKCLLFRSWLIWRRRVVKPSLQPRSP